jgi:hypothetical protein
MTFVPDIARLLRLSNHRQQRCEQTLQQAHKRLVPVAGELSEMAIEQEQLQQLMFSQRPEACVLSHPELMGLLRRQALLRRKLHNLALERARLDEQRSQIELEVQVQQQSRQQLSRKHMKFAGLQQRLSREHGQRLLRREETENEELSRVRHE